MTLQIGALASGPALPPGWYNVKDYGAVGDNSHDDTGGIQSAMNALKAAVNTASGSMGGQVLYFPPGYYKVSGTLDFSSLAEVTIKGYSGRGGWNRLAADGTPPTTIAFALGTGSASTGVNLSDCTGIIWDGVSVHATASGSTSYAGKLMKFDAPAAHDVFGNRMQNCQLRIVSGSSGCMLASLDGNIEFSFDNVTFHDAGGGVQAQGFDAASGNAKWANANSFRSCSFIGDRAYSVRNFGPQTTFVDCTFENANGSVAAPIRVDSTGQPGVDAWSFHGCGFWDSTSGTNPWIQTTVATYAWSFIGCHFDVPPLGVVFDMSTHTGLVLTGCFFDSASGTPNIFKPAQNITSGVMNGCYAKSPVVDNHASVFV